MRAPPFVLAAAIAAVLGTATDAVGQFEEHGLLFTVGINQNSTQCWAPPPPPPTNALQSVHRDEIQYVIAQQPGAPIRSWQYMPLPGYGELIGDADSDGSYWESTLFGANDALVRPRDKQGQPIPLNAWRMFISPRNSITHAGLGWTLRPGDLGRFIPGPGAPVPGTLELFMSEAQIKAALGIPAGVAVNVDAAAFVFDPQIAGVFLSFENLVMIDTGFGPVLVMDGAIVRIPMNELGFTASPHDGALLVSTVTMPPNMAGVWLSEPAVDALVIAAGVGDTAGACVPAIIDTDGLTIDPEMPGHLWFSGIGLDGCSVLTTAGGGAIAMLGPSHALGNPCPAPTTGTQVGLVPPAQRGLNGLSLVSTRLCHFTTDTITSPVPPGGAPVTIEVGGAPPGAPTWLLLGGWLDVPVGPADPSTPVSAACFDHYYAAVAAFPVPIAADGCGVWTAFFPHVPGVHVVAQALSVSPAGAPMLSTPSVVDLSP